MLVTRNDLNKVNITYKDNNISFSIDVTIRTSVIAKPGDQDNFNYNCVVNNKMIKYDQLGFKDAHWDLLMNYMLTINEWKKAILGKSIKSVILESNKKHEESLKEISLLTT